MRLSEIAFTPARSNTWSAGVTRDADDAKAVVIELEAEHGQAIFGFALRLGLRSDEADDAVQEVLLRLFRSLRGGAQIADPRAWAFRTMYRLAMDEHRHRRRIDGLRERLRTRDLGSSPTSPPIRSLSIWSDVDRLPARQRQVLYLHYQADLPFAAIAQVMGITAGGARAVAARGISALRGLVGPEAGGS